MDLYNNRLNRALEVIGDAYLVGLCTTVASVPLITLPAALSAGARAWDAREDGHCLRVLWSGLRSCAPAGAACGGGVLAAALVGAVDVAWALSRPLSAATSLVLGAGALAVVLALCALMGVAALLDGESMPMRRRLAAGVLTSLASPGRTIAASLLLGVSAAALIVLPVVLPLCLFGAARLLPRTPRAARQPAPRALARSAH